MTKLLKDPSTYFTAGVSAFFVTLIFEVAGILPPDTVLGLVKIAAWAMIGGFAVRGFTAKPE